MQRAPTPFDAAVIERLEAEGDTYATLIARSSIGGVGTKPPHAVAVDRGKPRDPDDAKAVMIVARWYRDIAHERRRDVFRWKDVDPTELEAHIREVVDDPIGQAIIDEANDAAAENARAYGPTIRRLCRRFLTDDEKRAVLATAEGGHHLAAWEATHGTDELPEEYR